MDPAENKTIRLNSVWYYVHQQPILISLFFIVLSYSYQTQPNCCLENIVIYSNFQDRQVRHLSALQKQPRSAIRLLLTVVPLFYFSYFVPLQHLVEKLVLLPWKITVNSRQAASGDVLIYYLQSRSRGFHFRSFHFHVTTLPLSPFTKQCFIQGASK